MKQQSKISILLALQAKGFDASLSRASKKLGKFGKNATKVGGILSVGISAPLALMGKIAISTAVEFEKSMSKVKAISGATVQEFEALTKSARDFGASTAFSATQVSGLQLELSKLGFDPKQITDSTEGILNLAYAFDQELAPTASAVAETLNQFGIDASRSGEVADTMAAAFANSALDLETFSEGMKNVAPVARAAGLSLKETTSLLGILANNGIKGSDAGTKLKIALTEIRAAGLDVDETLQKIVDGSFDFEGAIGLLGKRAQILNPILSSNSDELERLQGALYGSEGALDAAKEIMDETAAGSMARMNSALEGLSESFGTLLLPAVEAIAEAVSTLANIFRGMPDTLKLVVVGFGALLVVIPPLVFAVGSLATAASSLLVVLTPIAIGIGAIAAPALAAVAAFAPLILALGAVIALGPGIVRNIKKKRNTIKELDHSADKAAQSVGYLGRSFRDLDTIDDLKDLKNELKGIEGELKRVADAEKNRLLAATGQAEYNEELQAAVQSMGDINVLSERRIALATKIADAESLITAEKEAQSKLQRADAVQDEIDAFTDLVTIQQKLLDLGIGEKSAENMEAQASALMRIIEAGILAGESVDVYVDSLKRLNEQMEGMDMSKLEMKGPSTVGGENAAELLIGNWDQVPGKIAIATTYLERFQAGLFRVNEESGLMANTLSQAVTGIASSLTDAIMGVESFGEAMKGVLKELITAFIGQAIAAMIASAWQSASATGPAAITTGPAFMATGAASIGAMVATIPAFAEGGAVLGPTLAMVGEKPGSRGEAIIPFEKIGQFVGQVTGGENGGGTTNVVVTGRISGSDIALSNARGHINRTRRG